MYRRLLLAALFAASTAQAQTVVHVNLSCANNGTGSSSTCAASGGAPGAMNDLESAVEGYSTKDLVTAAAGGLEFRCHNPSDDTEDMGSGQLTTSGYTSNASNPLIIKSADLTAPCKLTSSAAYAAILRFQGAAHTKIDGLHLTLTAGGGNFVYGLRLNELPSSPNLEISNSVIRYTGTTTGRCYGAWLHPNQSSSTVKFWNNTLEGWDNCTSSFRFGAQLACTSRSNCSIVFYNNTLDGNGTGVELSRFDADSTSSIYFKNNLICNSAGSDYAFGGGSNTSFTSATNQTCDATSPDGASYQNVSATFTTTGLPDVTGDPLDAGTDLSADGQLSFSTDYVGTSRSGSWDIGAYEAASAGGAAIFRRRGR